MLRAFRDRVPEPPLRLREVLAARDGDAYTYMIESEVGVDIRKKLFWTMAEKKWPIIGLEALGMSIEDIFIAVVDKTDDEKKPDAKKKQSHNDQVRAAAEKEMASEIVAATASAAEETAARAEKNIAEETQGRFYNDYTIKENTFAEQSPAAGDGDADKPASDQ